MFMSTTYPMFANAEDLQKQYQALRGALARNGAPITELAALKVEFEITWRAFHMGLLVPMVPQVPQELPSPDNAISVPPKARKVKPTESQEPKALPSSENVPNKATAREALAQAKGNGKQTVSRDPRPKATGLAGVTFKMIPATTKNGNQTFTVTASHLLDKPTFALVDGIIRENGGKYFPKFGWGFKDMDVARTVTNLLNE